MTNIEKIEKYLSRQIAIARKQMWDAKEEDFDASANEWLKISLALMRTLNYVKSLPVFEIGQTNEHVGIDLGVKDFVITSDGEVFENKHSSNHKRRK